MLTESPTGSRETGSRGWISRYSGLLVTAGIVLVVDQVTKALVRSGLALGEAWLPFGPAFPWIRVVRWYNTGIVFGLFSGGGPLFAVLAVAVAVAIVYFYGRVDKEEGWLRLALGLELGGALGNLIDRLAFGYVTDFISVGGFAVFNVADSCVTIGVVILILALWRGEGGKEAGPSGGRV